MHADNPPAEETGNVIYCFQKNFIREDEMISFRSDYSLGAHPEVMQALIDTNMEQTDGYGMDPHCGHAAELVKQLIGTDDCAVRMMIGGTNCNVALIAAALRPYEAAVAARSGHIYHHETGAVEATGHKIIAEDGENGKLTPAMIDRAFEEYEDEHTVLPRLCDAFYIGGTKNGALFGEALVILNKKIDDHFRWMIKQKCGLLAKGRLIGVQFEALLRGGENSLYYRMAAGTNRMAERLRKGLEAAGCTFISESDTNQLFPVLPADAVHRLEKDFFFYEWAPEKDGMIPVRFVCSWGTTEQDVDALIRAVREGL